MEQTKAVQQRQFGFVHDFLTERTERMLDVLVEKFGDSILQEVAKAGIDRYGLYKWHLERTVSMLDILQENYGTEILDIVIKAERENETAYGRGLKKEPEVSALERIGNHFAGGDPDRIISKNGHEIIVRTASCLAGKIAQELGRSDILYNLHCGLDEYQVQGFDEKLGCEIVQSIMKGHDCCIHRLYVKESE